MVSGTRDNPPPLTPSGYPFSLFLCKIQPTVYIKITNPSRERENRRWTGCPALAGISGLELFILFCSTKKIITWVVFFFF